MCRRVVDTGGGVEGRRVPCAMDKALHPNPATRAREGAPWRMEADQETP